MTTLDTSSLTALKRTLRTGMRLRLDTTDSNRPHPFEGLVRAVVVTQTNAFALEGAPDRGSSWTYYPKAHRYSSKAPGSFTIQADGHPMTLTYTEVTEV